MYTVPWSQDEVSILTAHYPDHGRHWEGWETLLPDRTDAAIERKAHSIGLFVKHPKSRKKPVRHKKPNIKHHIRYSTQVANDPTELYVMKCMKKGMTPSQIDEQMKWWPGKAKRILQCRWEREK